MEKVKDTIYRQAAIDAMANTLWHYPNECYRNLNVYEFAKGLAELGLKSVPPAKPERKTGKWIMKYKGSAVTSYKCSECGRIVRDDTGYDVSKDYPFCHCGADMRQRGKQDG